MVLLLLAGCKGEALPEGMSEDELFIAGKDVMLLLVAGEYDTVHGLLREDQRKLVSVDAIEEAVSLQLDGAGVYKQIEDHMATGQNVKGERYAVSVLYCQFSEEYVLARIFFDKDWELVGFSLDQQ